MRSFEAVIEAIGVEEVAEIIGVTPTHVRVMRLRNSIAPEHWPKLVSWASARGFKNLDYPTLYGLRARGARRRAKVAP